MHRFRKTHLFIFLSIFLFSIVIMNRLIGSTFKTPGGAKIKKNLKTQVKAQEVFDEEKSKYHPKEDDPAKFNIKFQGQYDIPLTEKQWEYKMRQSLAPAGQGDGALQESLAGIEKSPAEIDERIANLTSQIKEHEAVVLNNPGDRAAQARLQNLYMLKATLTVLKERVARRSSRF